MTKTAEERYMEWLEREEDKFGIDFMERATTDVDTFRSMLEGELTDAAMAGNIQALIDAADTKYRDLGEIGARFERLQHTWGSQPVYRDLSTGRFLSRPEVDERFGR